MDKQDAIDFIVEAFENHRPPSEIARSLSREMNAPYEIVLRFVNRTLEQRMAFSSVPFMPAELDDTATPAEAPVETELSSADTAEGESAFVETPFAAAESAEAKAPSEPVESEYSDASTAAAVSELSSTPAKNTPPQMAEVSPAGVLPPAPAPSAAPSDTTIDPKLEKYILNALGSNRKNSDIVMAVCERTGLSWVEAQRVVGRVGARNRQQINSRRNRILVPLCIIAIIAGIGLLVAALSEASPYFRMIGVLIDPGSGGPDSQPFPDEIADPRFLAFYLVTGFTLALGGGYGLYQALTTHFE